MDCTPTWAARRRSTPFQSEGGCHGGAGEQETDAGTRTVALLGAMAVSYRTGEGGLGTVRQAAITPLQALSFMAFTLPHTPCLATVAAQLKESRSRSFAIRSVLWSLALAWVVALVVFQGATGCRSTDGWTGHWPQLRPGLNPAG
ncbi:nucleoside recognition domain-containing protein [Synechococcus sp. CCY 9618]|uniref:nucleoside recognition domain-containing protein n=1 Tax=Synechococcus sp. CCY 9618 TaxID=2815602 RepID=UPI001C240078|nr:nucleoside recognition domain-containing protein [Synechococcus sp. CCY 9618]